MRLTFRSALQAVATVALFCFLLTRPALGDPMVFVEPSNKSVTGAAGFSLDISISDVTDLFAFQFDLGFDPGVLAATGSTEGAFLPVGGSTIFIPGSFDNAAGTISGIADALVGLTAVSGDGVLATISFTGTGNGTSPITLFNVMLLDSNLNGIATTVQNGTVGVTGIPSAIPEPSAVLLLATVLLCTGLLATKRLRV